VHNFWRGKNSDNPDNIRLPGSILFLYPDVLNHQLHTGCTPESVLLNGKGDIEGSAFVDFVEHMPHIECDPFKIRLTTLNRRDTQFEMFPGSPDLPALVRVTEVPANKDR
jgi:hypothetical protein